MGKEKKEVNYLDYIGSKTSLNKWMFSIIDKNPNKKNTTFLDACSGTGVVGIYASSLGYKVVSNDILSFSSHIVIGNTSINQNRFKIARNHKNKINELEGIKGFFYNNYSEQSGRKYFTDENAKLIDACRQYIENISDEYVKSYLLYCGLEALSRVHNTASVQGAFLKNFKKSALTTFRLQMEWTQYSDNISTFNKDILALLQSKDIGEDILYIDPPYNERQYAPNYHLYETFAKYDNPKINGITGLREWSDKRSNFCKKSKIIQFLNTILNSTSARYVYLNYSSDGLISLKELKSLLEKKGDVLFYTQTQNRFKSDSKRKYSDTLLEEWFFELEIK